MVHNASAGEPRDDSEVKENRGLDHFGAVLGIIGN